MMPRAMRYLLLLAIGASAAQGANPVLLVSNKHEDTLAFVNPTTLEVIDTIPVGHNPHEMVITPDGRWLYASNYDPPGDTVSVVDLVRRQHVLQIPTGDYARIHSAAIAPDGRHVYFTATQSAIVVEIDTRTNKVTRGIPTHGKISHMVEVSPDGKHLYTANINTQNVSVLERATGKLVTQIPGDKGCEGLQFTPDGRYLWAANQNAGNITIIDVADHSVAATLDCPGMPVRIRFTKDSKRALVSNWLAEGEVVVFDVPNRKEIKRLRVGNQPIGLLITPDEKRAFVSNMTSDDVHVIDMETLTVTDRFTTGLGPDALVWWVPPDTKAKPASDVVHLLNGKDLSGWYTYLKDHGRDRDPNGVFKVGHGHLHISGLDWGYIATERAYENYRLVVEYKWGEGTSAPREHAARDSGIILHCTGEDGAYSGLWMRGIEVQMIEGGTGDLIIVGDSTERFQITGMAKVPAPDQYARFLPGADPVTPIGGGRIAWSQHDTGWEDVKGYRGKHDVEKPLGEWNHLDCLVVSNTITVTLNDQVINRAYDVRPSRGPLLIQSEGAEVVFRRIDLTPLTPAPCDH